MSENNQSRGKRPRLSARQGGTTAVEFAIVAMIFFTMVFGVIEIARLMYVINTLQEVTRRAARAAANTDFRDPVQLDRVRQYAVLNDAPGPLVLATPITDEFIRIDYLSVQRGAEGSQSFAPIPTASLPGSPAENRRICLRDPNDSGCIRLVRARICVPGGDSCAATPFPLFLPIVNPIFRVHTAPTIVAAESLGLAAAGAGGP